MGRNKAGVLFFFLLLPPGTAFSLSNQAPLGGVASPGEAPFHSFWTSELSAGYGAEGGGQNGAFFSLSAKETLNPRGSFFEAGLLGGTRVMERTPAAFGGFEMGGGVGLGDLTSFLLVEVEHGDADDNAIRVHLGFDKDLSPRLGLKVFLTGEVASHQGPFGQLVGLAPGAAAEIDGLNSQVGAALDLTALSPLELKLTLSSGSDETVKVQDTAHTVFNEVDSAEWVHRLVLEARWDMDPHFSLLAGATGGLDMAPAGVYYSERQGETLTAASARNYLFAGASLGAAYRF